MFIIDKRSIFHSKLLNLQRPRILLATDILLILGSAQGSSEEFETNLTLLGNLAVCCAWENHGKMVIYIIYIVIMAGWRWLEPWNFEWLSSQLGRSSSQLTNSFFQRGRYTTNQVWFYYVLLFYSVFCYGWTLVIDETIDETYSVDWRFNRQSWFKDITTHAKYCRRRIVLRLVQPVNSSNLP